ncbi:PKD-like family lipoprotein [Proteiniphilum sp. UBA5384]|uniref:PKD-like family lipoprotein n=1 Tax=Proteiniphilum sp. UBA5384 TaxID=1947279 RepID=UPI0025E6136B|nr:PKD-like family lipoprotein [Proteiniphilum sp. UBA5384]
MREKILHSLFVTGLLLLCGCSEDKGNYDYTDLNTVTIANIPAKSYAPGATIQIIPELSRSLTAGEENLSFQWEVAGIAISQERNLDALLPAMPYGQKDCAFIVTDNISGMKYYRTFDINIVNEFNYGYYFLTRQQDGSTIVAYLPSFRNDDKIPQILHTTVCGDVTFGKEPIKIAGSFGYINALGNYFWSMTIITKEGSYPVTSTNNGTFLPSTLVSEENFMDKNSGYVFQPEKYDVNPYGHEVFVSDGKLVFYGSGLLYRPAKHEGNYYWSHIRGTYDPYTLWAFDKLSRKFYFVSPKQNDPISGTIAEVNAYDRVIPITDSPTIRENEYFIGFSKNSRTNMNGLSAYTASNEGINIHRYEFDDDPKSNYGINHRFLGSTLLPVIGANQDTKCVSLENDCFFGIGNKIYTTPTELPTLSEFITIPPEYGAIIHLGLSTNETRLIVATYNPNSTAEKKGSVLFVDTHNKRITETFKEEIDECISILGANADVYGMTNGLGDDK